MFKRANEEIRAHAHELWMQQGRPSGRDVEFWLRAESEINTDRNH